MNPKQIVEPNALEKGEDVLGQVLWTPLIFLGILFPLWIWSMPSYLHRARMTGVGRGRRDSDLCPD